MQYKVLKGNQVQFTHLGIVHIRDYNPILNSAGKVDKKATEARIKELANGVQKKIELGVITAEEVNGAAD